MPDIMRVFVGCAANHEDAESQAVLEYTIRKHASRPVQITWMMLSRDPSSPFYSNHGTGGGWNTSQWATPFSGFRWAVPELAGFSSRALYMDSDIIVRADLAELFDMAIEPTKVVIAKGGNRFCVSLWDCERAQRWLQPLAQMRRDAGSHRRNLATFNPSFVQMFPKNANWNCLDGESYKDLNAPEIKAIHYTSMRNQPQLPYAVKRLAAQGRRHWFDGAPEPHFRRDLQRMFDEELAAAEAAGFVVDNYTQTPLFGTYVKRSVGNVGKPGWVPKERLAS